MLPGIRFLFATMLIALSLAVCGIGATALLRAAQQNSANLPSLQAMRDPFPPPASIEPPTLALMRIEIPPAPDQLPANDDLVATSQVSASQSDVATETSVTAPSQAEPEKQAVAASNPQPDIPLQNAPPENNAAAAPEKQANETLAEKTGDDTRTMIAPVVTPLSIVVSKAEDTTPSQKTSEPQTSEQGTPASAVEKTTSAISPDADTNLVTGSLPAPAVALPVAKPKPKPAVTKARVTRRVTRRRVARAATPRPQAAAKPATPFSF